MVAEAATAAAAADIFYQQSVSVQYQLCVSQQPSPQSALSIEISRSESAFGCSTSIPTATFIDSAKNTKFLPSIRSGSHTDIGPRKCNEDEHIRIDDLSTQLGSLDRWPMPSSFYAVFDGHGGSDAAAYVKNNAMKLFFNDADLPQKSDDIDEIFLEELVSSQRRAFLIADRALANECSVDASCGTTAITALVVGRHLLIANAGDCRAVLCRKGVAMQISRDHRPSCVLEKKRVEDLGGYIEYGYLNGELAVTRALGDWSMKQLFGSASPLIAEPEVQHMILTEDDEFLIIGCDGIWDVMSNQEAVSLVRRELRQHDDPQLCAKEIVSQALLRDRGDGDNLTVIVVCFTSADRWDSVPSQRPSLRFCNLSEEARRKLRSVLEGN